MIAPASRYRLPLLGSLLIAVALELAVHRALLQFLKPEVLEPESELFRLFNGGVGPLVFYFSSFLALATCAWVLILVVREDSVFSLPWRVVVGLFSCVFLPVCAVGAFVSQAGLRPLSLSLRELHPYLNLFFAPMLAALSAGLLSRPGALLAKVGTLLLVLPLFGFAYYSYRTASSLGQTPVGVSLFEQLRPVSAIPQGLRTFFLHSGPLVFLAFIPLVQVSRGSDLPLHQVPPASRLAAILRAYVQALLTPGPLVAGLCVGLLVGVGLKLGFDPLRTAVDAAFAFDLPPPSSAALLALGSLFLYAWTIAALAWRSGPNRTVALGLLCLGVAGLRLSEPLHSLQLPEPLYYLVSVIGLLALCVGIAGAWDQAEAGRLRERSPALPDHRWISFLGRCESAVAGRKGEESAVRWLVEQEVEISGFEGRYQGLPLSFYVRRREGRVESLTLMLGEALSQAPDWSALPRIARFWREEDALAPLAVRDRVGLSGRLLGEGYGGRLGELDGGALEVWSSVGLRFRFQVRSAEALERLLPVSTIADPRLPLPSAAGLQALLELLRALALRAGVSPRLEAVVPAVLDSGPAPADDPAGAGKTAPPP